MKHYSCKIRLNGNVMHEVTKVVTVPEIILLRILHNDDGKAPHEPVVDIKCLIGHDVQRTDAEERARLDAIYGRALRANKRYPHIDAIFGVGQPLPRTTEGVVVLSEVPVREIVHDPEADPMAALA